MREIFPDIYEILPTIKTLHKYRSFFVKRATDNLLIPCFSAHSTIEGEFDVIDALGGLKYQLLGDSHFKSAHCDVVATRFNAPLYCREVEAPDVSGKLKQVVTFPFQQHHLDPTLEVIPTPGHRPGGVCYRVSVGPKRYLFAGDFIWHDGEHWMNTSKKSSTRKYAESIRLLAGLDFDVLLANSILNKDIFYIELDQETRTSIMADLLEQIEEKL